ncbi:diguanylate cyclase domain-containing protein [Candidatus Nitrospira bockiana]
MTVSIGAAETTPQAVKPEQVLRQAEQALQRAKQAGRNEVRALA